MNINAINQTSFGQRQLGTIDAGKNDTSLNFVEYEYGFFDMLHLRDQIDTWEPSAGNKGRSLYNRFCDHYMNGGYLKRYFGVEDEEGNVKAIVEADVQDDKTNAEEFGTIKPSKVAFNPDVDDMKTPEMKKGIKAQIEKYSKECKELFADIITRRTRVLSFDLDEDGHIQETTLELNA